MRTPVFEPQGSAGTRNPTFGAPGRGAPEFVFHHPVLLRPSRPCLTLVGPAPSAGLHSLPASPRRPLSAGIHAVPRHLPSTPPPARQGTSSKHRPSIHPCGKTATPQLPRSPRLDLHPARFARPWRLRLHSSWQTSSCATVPSTTSTRTGSPASPSSSVPQGAPPCRPSRCHALRPAQEARSKRYLHRLLPKKAPWLQDARPQDETLRVRCPRDKKGAAKRSLGLKKALACSPL